MLGLQSPKECLFSSQDLNSTRGMLSQAEATEQAAFVADQLHSDEFTYEFTYKHGKVRCNGAHESSDFIGIQQVPVIPLLWFSGNM